MADLRMIRLELTKAQKEQIRAATGREVNVLELRLQRWPELARGVGGAMKELKETLHAGCKPEP
jgi:hypothetical protein